MAVETRQETLNDQTALPKRVTDCKNYVEVGQPKAERFDNSDKSIDQINTMYTHCVAEHYALT